MKLYFIAFIFSIFSLSAKAQVNQPTIIYLVRHAEKVTTDTANKNPTLTNDGIKRATTLAKKLRKVKLEAVYSTDFNRTKLTAQPIATKNNLTVTIYNHKKIKVFADSLLIKHKGQHILIVGHSNSVVETIEAFGIKRPIANIAENEFDYFFTVTINQNGNATVATTRYGKKNTEISNERK